jgi:hypothetical protein
MPNIIEIEGIGEVYAGKLLEAGVPTTEALLEAGRRRKAGRPLPPKRASATG